MSTATIDSTVADRMRAHREQMVAWHLESRGIHDETVLKAMREVPREEFVPHDLIEYAYEDSSLPIDEQQTISQPYIVALMAQALELGPGDRVLEVGSGSGYAAAILGRIAGEVFTIEWYASLAASAAERCSRLGYANVHVRQGDGTLGWPEEAPFDAIAVAAGGPEIPRSLLAQLAVGGRLVIPVGPTPRLQSLVRVRRTEQGIETENLGGVAFVPLVGAEGWTDTGERRPRPSAVMPDPRPVTPTRVTLAGSVAKAVEPLDGIWEGSLVRLMERIGDARIVCLGEASHGTAEFYDMRTRITRELVERKGFTIVAVEADWPDARQIDGYVRDTWVEPGGQPAFQRFPTWMWANGQVLTLLYWMREYNESVAERDRSVGFYGLDLYSLYNSIDSVVRYLDDVDPEAARVARHRYGCLSPWQGDPAAYGAAATSGRYEACEQDVVQMLRDLLEKRFEYTDRDGERFLDAAQNARLITNAERYYRTMYRGGRASWNLRDTHMFDTLETLLRFRGPDAGAVVWAHNSHLGNASATGDGRGRPDQRRTVVPGAIRKRRVSDRLRHGSWNRRRSHGLGWPDGNQAGSALPRAELREGLSRERNPVVPASSAGRRGGRRAGPAAAGASGASDRGDLPARDGDPEPLLLRESAPAVRRVHLVPRDASRGSAYDRHGGRKGPSGDVPVRALTGFGSGQARTASTPTRVVSRP